MRKIRVMHLIHQLNAGGAENGIINIANHIDTNLFDISICSFVGNGTQINRLDKHRATLFELTKASGNDLRLPLHLFGLFKNWWPDIVHTHAWGTLCEGVGAAILARVPVVIHGEHGTMQEKKHNILVQRMVWRFADRILSVSHHHANELSKRIGFPLGKITVLVNGVDSKRFDSGRDGRSIKAGLNLHRGDIILGTVGRLVAVKNQSLLIRALSCLSRDYPNLKLIIAGDGPLRRSLEKLAVDAGCPTKIQFLGRRSDVPEFMAALDIFALTSKREGMSNTILEAMSSGLPVVATAVGGNPELVIDRETGILTPVDDVLALAKALEELIKHPEKRQRMGLAGRERVEKHFSLTSMVRNYEQLYLKCFREKMGLLNRPGSRRE